MLKIFGKRRESLRIGGVKASRALFENHVGNQEVHIELVTEEGDILTLQIPPHHIPKLVMELSNAYEAINPPLRRNMGPADWYGMQ